jgi:cyclopropane fatty-acyl-phospholipid synthase-like methyltransferase
MTFDPRLETIPTSSFPVSLAERRERPESMYADGVYLEKNPTWHSEDSAWKADQATKMLARHGQLEPRTICEVGCGAGQVLVELQKKLPKETSFFGYDISPDAYRMCLPKTNDSLHFSLPDFSEFRGEPFDLLLVLDVAEHVCDYLGFLRNIREKARFVLFHIPLELTVHGLMRDVLMLNRRTYGHLHHFTKDTALATLQDCGYNVLDWFYTPSVVDQGLPGIKSKISNLVRRAGFRIARDESVLILGGYSLMVLTRPEGALS